MFVLTTYKFTLKYPFVILAYLSATDAGLSVFVVGKTVTLAVWRCVYNHLKFIYKFCKESLSTDGYLTISAFPDTIFLYTQDRFHE